MTITKKHFTIIALLACVIALSTWAIIEYKTKREINDLINKNLALRFDETIDDAFPLLENYALAMKDRSDSIEILARKAKKDTCHEYRYAFTLLWEVYAHSEKGKRCYELIEEYEYFKISPVIEMLINSGDNKKKESDAIKKLTWAGMLLKKPLIEEFDTLMNASKEARQYISDYMEVMEPYRSEETNIRAWRELMLGKRRTSRSN